MLPSSTDISEASTQSENHEALVRVSRTSGSIPANSLQEADGIHSSHITPNMHTSSSVKLTSPERIIALHRELRQNYHRNCQVSKVYFVTFILLKCIVLDSQFTDPINI